MQKNPGNEARSLSRHMPRQANPRLGSEVGATGTSGLIGVFATSKSWEMLFADKDKSSLICLFRLSSPLLYIALQNDDVSSNWSDHVSHALWIWIDNWQFLFEGKKEREAGGGGGGLVKSSDKSCGRTKKADKFFCKLLLQSLCRWQQPVDEHFQ